MKYLLLLLVVMGLVFLSGVRKGRAGGGNGPGSGRGPDGGPRDPHQGAEAAMMVSCAECGTHLPQSEAFPGRGGHFCCAEHRQRHEARQGHG
ncbi:PP0621 family protein [Pelomonas sp. BJYL3]|uniref:PP0621 family protein n=1 Tax=Pelomonas sp. BJYL3 TaxID=2976697 RepID=UPI0022B4064F|nr:PP0621 family protein [Pelomonas sp. BJYL3]